MSVKPLIALAILATPFLLTGAAADQQTEKESPLKVLVERLGSDDVTVRKDAGNALQMRAAVADAEFGGVTGLPYDDDLATLERFRNEARPLVPLLVKLLPGPHEESAAAAAVVLGAIGPVESSRLALRKVIRDAKNSHRLRIAAVPAILRVTPAQQIVGREFVEGFVDDSGDGTDEGPVSDGVEIPPWNDETSAASYGPMLAAILIATGRSTIEVSSLLEVTPAAFPRRLRLTAIIALAVLEADATHALPALRKLLNDDDALVRKFSGLAILRIGGDDGEIPAIMKAVSLREPESAKFLQEANEFFEQKEETSHQLRKDAGDLVPMGMKMLNHRNSFHKRQAIRMLGEIGPPAKEALPALKELLADPDSDTCAVVAESIRKIEMTADSASKRGQKGHAK